MCHLYPHPPRKSAFTLVELLVVIAIIIVLIALLLPALSKAKQTALVAVCGSNLRQIGNAMSMYLDENNNCFPYPAITPWPHFSWHEKLTRYLDSAPQAWRGEPPYDWHQPPATTNNVSDKYWSDVMTNYHDKYSLACRKIFHDPVYTQPGPREFFSSPGPVKYAINRLLLDDYPTPPVYVTWNPRQKAYRARELARPIVLVGPSTTGNEGNSSYFPWWMEYARHKSSLNMTELPAGWYPSQPGGIMPLTSGGENYLYTDFHVEWTNASELWVRRQHHLMMSDPHFAPSLATP